DLVSPQSSSHPLTILPSLEIHGHGYTNRPQPSPSSIPNYSRSNANNSSTDRPNGRCADD
ncbi:unnamed protein product, partial [Rotaria sp. Silwood1]